MKKIAAAVLAALALCGCSADVDEAAAGRVRDEEGRILLDNIYSCEKIAGLEDGGAYNIASVGGKTYFSGWNEDGYDVFVYDGSTVSGLEFGFGSRPDGIGAADGGLAFVSAESDRERGARVMLYFTDGDALSEGIDFTDAMPGISDEIEMNGMPDFTVGAIPGGAAVSDGSRAALVYRDGRTEKLDLPGSIMSVTADSAGELCLYIVNAVADRFVYTLSDGELTLVSDDIPEIKSAAVYKAGEDLLMLTETGFYRAGDGKAEMIMNFENSSVVWSEQYRFAVVSADEIYYSGVNDVTKDNGLYRLTPAEDQYRRVIDVLNFSDDALETFATLFNSSQSEYFVIGARPQSDPAADPAGLLGEFDKKLLAGDCGDLVCLDSGFDWEIYANQRIFADISHLFDEGELFDCVADSFVRDGKMYAVCRSFSLRTMYTLDGYWSETEMTPQELIAYAWTLPEDSRLFWSMSRANVQSIFLAGMGAYIGDEAGFSAPEFTDSLGFIASVPEEFDTSGLSSGAAAYVDGSVKFMTANVYSIESWLDTHRFEADGKRFTETGFPTKDGGRAAIYPLEYYAVPVSADEREGAEEFLRFVLNCHTRMGDMGIPADVTAFRDKMEDAKAYYFEYEPGRIGNVSAGRAEWYEPGNENQELITDGLIAEFEEWLTDIDCVIPVNTELESIINEEIGAYLSGLCTAEECAGRIDSRVGIYLSERS